MTPEKVVDCYSATKNDTEIPGWQNQSLQALPVERNRVPLPVCVTTVRSGTELEAHRSVPLVAELVRSSTCGGVLRKNKGKEQHYFNNS